MSVDFQHHVTRMMDARLRDITSTPPAPGYDRVLYAGLPEWEAQQDRTAKGVLLHPTVVEKLRALAREEGLQYDP